jgi:hypothetical protein
MRTELHSLIAKLQTYMAQGWKADLQRAVLQLGSLADADRTDPQN